MTGVSALVRAGVDCLEFSTMARVQPPNDNLQAEWRNLCLYLRDCVQYEVSSRALRKSLAAYVPLKGMETLLTQGAASP